LGQNDSANPGYDSKHSRKRASPTAPDQNPRYDPPGDLADFTFADYGLQRILDNDAD